MELHFPKMKKRVQADKPEKEQDAKKQKQEEKQKKNEEESNENINSPSTTTVNTPEEEIKQVDAGIFINTSAEPVLTIPRSGQFFSDYYSGVSVQTNTWEWSHNCDDCPHSPAPSGVIDLTCDHTSPFVEFNIVACCQRCLDRFYMPKILLNNVYSESFNTKIKT